MLITALALAVAAPLALPPSVPFTTSAEERRLLARGGVVVRLAPGGLGDLREGMGIAVLDLPPERVYRALTDFRHYPEWAPFVVRSTARDLGGGAAEQEQWLDLPAPVSDRRYRLRFDGHVERTPGAARWQLRWDHLPGSGNVRGHRGAWGLAALDDGRTLAWCRVRIDPGGLLPAWLVNRTVGRALPWLLDGLRQQAHRWRYDPRAPADAP